MINDERLREILAEHITEPTPMFMAALEDGTRDDDEFVTLSEALAAMCRAATEAAEGGREECAKICDDVGNNGLEGNTRRSTAKMLAVAIRSRSNKEDGKDETVQEAIDRKFPPAPCSPAPIPMLLWCPECSSRHYDVGEFETKPHHTHACQTCGHVWRPAIVATVGVQFLPGFKNPDALERGRG